MFDLRLKRSQMLRDAGYSADYLDMTYKCEKCLDTGYVDNEKCDCYKKLESELIIDESNLKEWLKKNNFSCLSREQYQGEELDKFNEAVDTCHKFVNKFDEDYYNLLFCGNVGTGKSFLAGCIVNELLKRSCKVLFINAIQLFQTISSNIYDRDKTLLIEYKQKLYNYDLLVIDDLGTELTNEFVRSELFDIINERILRQKALIITTNYSMTELLERYQERIFSRIEKDFIPIKLSCRNIRYQESYWNKTNN